MPPTDSDSDRPPNFDYHRFEPQAYGAALKQLDQELLRRQQSKSYESTLSAHTRAALVQGAERTRDLIVRGSADPKKVTPREVAFHVAAGLAELDPIGKIANPFRDVELQRAYEVQRRWQVYVAKRQEHEQARGSEPDR